MNWRSGTIALLALLGVATALPAAEPKSWKALLDRYAPSVVTLRLTLRTEMEGSGAPPEDSSDEVQGAVVDPSGLILVWNSHLAAGRTAELFSHFGGDEGMHMKVTPTDIKVLLAGESRERPAFLAAADSDLDLAFVQLEEKPEQALAAVDFAQAATLAVGDELGTVSRLSSSFDRAAFFDTVRITGELKKPRPAWIVAGGNATQVGMPYFSVDGRPAGVLVTFLSRSGEPTTRDANKIFADLMSLGRGQSEVGPMGLFLLPAERVNGVVQLARQRAAELLAERQSAAAKP
jgi:hypothetical protein